VPAKPAPRPDPVSEFYWAGAAAGVLLVSRCAPLGHLSHPPEPSCPTCGSRTLEPVEVSGRGEVYSYTVVRQAFDAAFLADVPYVVALVELEEQRGLRVLANLVDVEADAVTVGMPVAVGFEVRGDQRLPQFRPRRATAPPAPGRR
jgi:uncharacterized OB-fold protein